MFHVIAQRSDSSILKISVRMRSADNRGRRFASFAQATSAEAYVDALLAQAEPPSA